MNEHNERHDMNCDCFIGDGLQHHHIFFCPICGTATKNLEATGAEIDRKFRFAAFNPYNGKRFTSEDGVVFLAKDTLVVPMLETYLALVGKHIGWGSPEAEAVRLMIGRIVDYQAGHRDLCRLPDLAEGSETEELLRQNPVVSPAV
jgi:hypothetical protein